MYEQLIANLRAVDEYDTGYAKLIWEAADAIEELSMKLHGDEAAIAGMKREIERMVVNAPRWIPVTERLPQRKPDDIEYPTVLVELNDGSVNFACYYESTKKWGIGEEYCCLCEPTHWMPLPEPPKEGE